MAEELRQIDIASETWGLIRDHFAGRMEEACNFVIEPGHSIDEYNLMRGRIAAYEEIFRLAQPKAKPKLDERVVDPSGL